MACIVLLLSILIIQNKCLKFTIGGKRTKGSAFQTVSAMYRVTTLISRTKTALRAITYLTYPIDWQRLKSSLYSCQNLLVDILERFDLRTLLTYLLFSIRILSSFKALVNVFY